MEIVYTCKICGETCKNFRSLSAHIFQKHKEFNHDLKAYYDKYIEPGVEHKCKFCGKQTKFHNLRIGYSTTCGSKECAHKKEEETRFKKYEGSYWSEASKEKMLNNYQVTMMTRYGVKHNWSSKELREIGQYRTCELKYGDRNYNNPEKMKETRANWNEEKKERFKKHQSEVIRETYKNSPDIVKRIQEKRNKKKAEIETKIHLFYENQIEEWNRCNSEKIRAKRLSVHVYRCLDCGEVFVEYNRSRVQNRQYNGYGLCPKCHNLVSGSRHENEILKIINEFYDGEVIQHDRNVLNGKELDIYLPKVNLAIEFDGLYWHRDDKNSALWKTEECEKNGVHLLHIWENEWIHKRNIVIDRIKSLLGLNERIFARKTKIKKLDDKTYREFVEKYHIQGYVRAKYVYGLIYGDELIAIASFGASRFRTNETELLRYCSKAGVSVIGGMKKLVKHFKEYTNMTEVISYADRRYTTKLHSVYGNNCIGITPPGYHYFYAGVVYNRIKFQKHKLKTNILTKDFYDEKLTEKEICELSGLYRIYDCGQLKYSL